MNIEELQKQIMELNDKNKELENKLGTTSKELEEVKKDLGNARDLNAKLMNRFETREEPKKKVKKIYTDQELANMED